MSDNNETDQLAQRLNQVLPPNQSSAPKSDANPAVDAALRLANASRLKLSPEAMTRIQVQVMAANNAKRSSKIRRLKYSSLGRTATVASIFIVLCFVGLLPAMASSVPGDFLYPAKLTIEQVELVFATSDSAQAKVHLTHAERRTEEARTLISRGDFEPALIDDALDEMIASAEAAGASSIADSELQARTHQVNQALDSLLLEADTKQLVSHEIIVGLNAQLQEARDDGLLFLTPTITLTPEVTEAIVITATVSPSPTETETETETPQPTATLEMTARPTEFPQPTPSISAIIFAARSVNVRSGPGLNFEIIALLEPGSNVPVIEWNNNGTWLHIRLDDGRDGWIASELSRIYDVSSEMPELPSVGTIEGGDTSDKSNQSSPSGDNPVSTVSSADSVDSTTGTNSGDSGNTGNNGQGGNFGCGHPGNYCNTPNNGNGNGNGGNGNGGGKGK